jgi:hypothetical protein
MVSQVPAVTYAVMLARARRFVTPLGTVAIQPADSPRRRSFASRRCR